MSEKMPVFETRVLNAWVAGSAQALPATVCGVTQDTRALTPGCLYVALRGERVDGHDFVAQALRDGAAAALVEDSWQAPAEARAWPLIRVRDTREALCSAAGAWRRQSRARIVGVTGSSGKTTVKEMTTTLLRARGSVCATRGNYNNAIGLPLSLLRLCPETAFGVFEIGTNHPGEIAVLSEILQADAAMIASIGSAHIEYFGTLAAIAREKGALLERLPRTGFAVLCQETQCFEQLREMSSAPVITTSLVTRTADYSGVLLDPCVGSLEVFENATGKRTLLASGLPGEHNASNLLLAFAMARTLGVAGEESAQALKELVLPKMRWEVSDRHGVKIINDAYNANPQSMQAALKTFMSQPCTGRRFVVLGDMLELGKQAEACHREVGRVVAALAPDGLIAVGSWAGGALVEAALKGGYARDSVHVYADAVAARSCRGIFQPGDQVLLKASRGMHLEYFLDDWQI